MRRLLFAAIAFFGAAGLLGAQCIPTGVTDQYLYFIAVDNTDLVTRETTSTLTIANIAVERARNGGTAATYTTPTIAEVDSTDAPGVYSLLLDEDMTITAGNHAEQVMLHIDDSGAVMEPVTLTYWLCRPDVTAGETLTVTSGIATANTTQIEGVDATNQINTEADAAIVTYGLDHLVSAAVVGADVTDDSIIAQIVGDDATADWDTFDNTTDSLEALRNNQLTTAQVNTEADNAIVTYGLDHLVGAAVVGADVTDDSIIAQLAADDATADWDTFDNTTDSLEALQVNSVTTAALVDAVWDEDIVAAHTTADTAGALLQELSEGRVLESTTIATLASQVSFTLTAGSTDDDAYNGQIAIITDATTATQKAIGHIGDYTGSTRTVTLSADPGIFTMAATDLITIVPMTSIIEGVLSEPDILRVMLAFVAGQASGGGTTTVTFDAQDDTTGRIIMTVDAAGDRSAVTIDAAEP